ncbi:MAG: hypothetical protein ABI679_09170 [Gemmatimonadota bacterium]
MRVVNIAGTVLIFATLAACHRGIQSTSVSSVEAKSLQERALATALRWVPTSTTYQGLPVVLMAGAAHGDYRGRWVDSIVAARVIHHQCDKLTVAECPDSARLAYVGFEQPRLGANHSADVTMTIVIMNPSTCRKDSAAYTEVTGRLHIPSLTGDPAESVWAEEESLQHHC